MTEHNHENELTPQSCARLAKHQPGTFPQKEPYMTGIEAFESIVESLKDHHRAQPDTLAKVLRIPWGTAYDLAKLGRAELGELSDRLLTEGVAVLEKQGFKGFAVVIDWKKQYGDVVAA